MAPSEPPPDRLRGAKPALGYSCSDALQALLRPFRNLDGETEAGREMAMGEARGRWE